MSQVKGTRANSYVIAANFTEAEFGGNLLTLTRNTFAFAI